ncbi:putative MFS transporter [Ophiocordyceps camponoti-floridani]|uniref:Putative MFS transporter n=1 Tax=Ophiocordyceps camponoti-floridani TaxID=2030778 RepID=A0A8H4QCW1_9HYPO|nr:putative MFS transporter [Ophiocordyceps camponoti-floridani]
MAVWPRTGKRRRRAAKTAEPKPEPKPEPKTRTSPRLAQLKAVLVRLEPDVGSVFMAFKMTIAPLVCICLIQSTAWTNHYKTNGYLVALIANLALPFLPRGTLIKFNVQLALATAVSYCYVLLAGWCGLQARKHTTHSPEQLKAYNSSAEAVVAIFLIFCVWTIFSLKSAYPSLFFLLSIAGIYAVSTLPGLARASTIKDVINQSSNVVESFLTGQAFGFFVGIVILPRSGRDDFRKAFKGCLDGLVVIVRAHEQCMSVFKARPPDYVPPSPTSTGDEADERAAAATKLQEALKGFTNGVIKARAAAAHAKLELSFGRLDNRELRQMMSGLIDLVPPASGLFAVADMLKGAIDGSLKADMENEARRRRGTDATLDGRDEEEDDDGREQEEEATHDWHQLEEAILQHLHNMSEAIVNGVEHAKLRFHLTADKLKLPFLHRNQEESASAPPSPRPGDENFLESFRGVVERECDVGQGKDGSGGEKLMDHYIRHRPKDEDLSRVTTEKQLDYSQTLLSSLSNELEGLLITAEDYYGKPSRLIIPHLGHLDWLKVFRLNRKTTDDSGVELGAGFRKRDPDHVPPVNAFERVGNYIRLIPAALRSEHAAYGLRGACAIMTIAIVAFLRCSQSFFFRQRLLWALFAIIMSLGRTSGNSNFLLMSRTVGTIASMFASYIIWYIVDQKTAGIYVFLELWLFFLCYLLLKFPPYSSAIFVAVFTTIIMICNDLQIRKIGASKLETQFTVYPPFVNFPYRLAIVLLGVATAYFWTVFPFPLSEHGQLRQEVGSSFNLLGNYYSCISQAVISRLEGSFGDPRDEASPGFYILAARRRIFRKYQTSNTAARSDLGLVDWEFSLGGRFPKKIYGEILSLLDRIASYMTLTGYASRTFQGLSDTSAWRFVDEDDVTRSQLLIEGVTTRMVVLHSALSQAHPLPPQLRELTRAHMPEFSSEIRSEGVAAAALIHGVNSYIVRDINRLTQLVKDLVGELDFTVTVETDGEIPLASARNSRPST